MNIPYGAGILNLHDVYLETGVVSHLYLRLFLI